MADTLSDLRTYVRDLTGIYSTDLIADALLNRWINEAYFELARLQKWSWAEGLQELVEPGNPSPVFLAEYHPMLAYRVGSKVLGFESDDTNRAELFNNEYSLLLNGLQEAYLRTNTATAVTTRRDIREFTKSILGEYSRTLPDSLLDAWVNEEYQVLAAEHPWRWLQLTHQEDLVPGQTSFALPFSSRRVLEVYIVEKRSADDDSAKSVSYSEIVELVPHVLDIEVNAAKYKYKVEMDGVINLLPVPPRALSVRVRYLANPNQLATDADQPLMDLRFRSLLAYRTALRAAAYMAAPEGLVELCQYGADKMFNAMYSEYQLSHSMEPLQIGAVALETRKYMPWFRAD